VIGQTGEPSRAEVCVASRLSLNWTVPNGFPRMPWFPDRWRRTAIRALIKCRLRAFGMTPESRRVNYMLRMHDQCSDGEFLQSIIEFFHLHGGPLPSQIEQGKLKLKESRARRVSVVRRQMLNYIYQLNRSAAANHNPDECFIMGTRQLLTPSIWAARAAELNIHRQTTRLRSMPKKFAHSGNYLISAIASLYKGGPYIEQFLENMTSQSFFDQAELIIIDAHSPDGEAEVIKRYQSTYNNIVYRRLDRRVGIYEAWNLAIKLARGKYLTNTNLDDLRRIDSIELQARALESCHFADVTYQDVFYTLDHTLSFDEISKFNFKTELPLVTAHNLLEMNLPHNAPMWRKSLHDEVGFFDASLTSAADWEFWLRCYLKGKTFWKNNTPHVSYFQNPRGVSTNPDTLGMVEIRMISRKYSGKLTSRYLVMSRKSLADALDVNLDWDTNSTHYSAVQRHLASLGASRRVDGISE